MKRIILVIILLGVLMTAVLKLHDGTNTIDLLGQWRLNNWTPKYATYKGGGTWRESSLSEGRRLVDREWGNAIETFDLKGPAVSQDEAAVMLQYLEDMLEKAADYGEDRWDKTPVYLEAKSSRETNTRYALVYQGRISEFNNPYAQPFLQADCRSLLNDIGLIVERGHWMANPPGESDCVEVSGENTFEVTETTVTVSVSSSSDDGWHHSGEENFNLTNNDIHIGYDLAAPTFAGLRFQGVNVPQGATIINAYITFECSSANANTAVYATIHGELSSSPSAYSTGSEFESRNQTESLAYWPAADSGPIAPPGIPAWVLGTSYLTPSLRDIVQEIIDLPTWSSGNNMAFMIRDNGSDAGAFRSAASQDHATRAAPQLTIIYTGTEDDFGRDATCDQEVYIANKYSQAQITDVYGYDGANWTANLRGTYPYNLFDAALAAGDMMVFGCRTSLDDSGPFCSLVFDISETLSYGTGDQITWQYWSGAAWSSLVNADYTSELGYLNPFVIEGVNAVVFEQPDDWATMNLNTTFGGAAPNVDGYWVRAYVSNITTGITGPAEQQNRDVYTVDWPSVDIDELQIGGVIPAISQMRVWNETIALPSTSGLDLETHRIIAAARTNSRGSNFQAYLPASDEQLPAGISVDDPSGGMASVSEAPSGRAIQGTINAATYLCNWTIQSETVPSYVGRYRAFVRALWDDGGVGTADGSSINLHMNYGNYTAWESGYITLPCDDQWLVLDMGTVRIDPPGIGATDTISRVLFSLFANGDGGDMTLIDLILMPIDEWVGDFVDPYLASGTNMQRGYYVDIDSVSNPKEPLVAWMTRDDGQKIQPFRKVGDKPFLLRPQRDQRLWFLAMNYDSTDEVYVAEPWMTHRIQLFANKRYLSLRGDQ